MHVLIITLHPHADADLQPSNHSNLELFEATDLNYRLCKFWLKNSQRPHKISQDDITTITFVLFLDIYRAAKEMKIYHDLIIRACSIFIAYVDQYGSNLNI